MREYAWKKGGNRKGGVVKGRGEEGGFPSVAGGDGELHCVEAG